MILLSNPDGIANLSDIRDRAPSLAAAAEPPEAPANHSVARGETIIQCTGRREKLPRTVGRPISRMVDV